MRANHDSPPQKTMNTLLIEKNNFVTTVTLNRPDVHNAFNEVLVKELYDTFTALNNDNDTNVIVLTGSGKSFSAGADLNYMKSAATKSKEQNIAESLTMAKMLIAIDEVSKPLIGVVNGAALGGGMGLMSVCDVVIAHESAQFGFTEAKLGLAPSVISPFVIRKIGAPAARRYFLTAEHFGIDIALKLNLVNDVYNDSDRDEKIQSFTKKFLGNAPQAMSEIKKLIRMNQTLANSALTQFTAEQIATLRGAPEAQERIRAFFEKRPPK